MKWLVALLLIPLAIAQPGDYDDYDGYDYSGGCIEGVELSGSGTNQIDYEYAHICEGDVQSAEFRFETGNDPSLMLEAAFVEASGQSWGSVFAAELEVGLLGIVMYEDADGDGAFNADVDEAVEQDAFSASGWESIQATEEDGVTFRADYAISFGGTFTVSGKAIGQSYSEGGVRVNPADTKIDFAFSGITYPTETARLALVLGIGSEVASVQGGTPGGIQGAEAGVAVGGAQSAYFTWAKTAMVDGRSTPVVAYDGLEKEQATVEGEGTQVQAQEAHGVVSLTYAQGEEIVHDPRLGVAFANSSKDSPLPVVLVVPALATVLWLRRR